MKNSTVGKTSAFIKERKFELDCYQKQPFYGQPLAEQMYKTLKKRYTIVQVSVCGVIVRVVHYKKDEVEMYANLRAMFPESNVRQTTSNFTELVTTCAIPVTAFQSWIQS